MVRVGVYWCIMMLSALLVLIPSIGETLRAANELARFLPLGGLIASAIGMSRAMYFVWRAGRGQAHTSP